MIFVNCVVAVHRVDTAEVAEPDEQLDLRTETEINHVFAAEID